MRNIYLSRKLPGIDHQASLEPRIKRLILDIRECKESLGSPIKFRTPEEENTAPKLQGVWLQLKM